MTNTVTGPPCRGKRSSRRGAGCRRSVADARRGFSGRPGRRGGIASTSLAAVRGRARGASEPAVAPLAAVRGARKALARLWERLRGASPLSEPPGVRRGGRDRPQRRSGGGVARSRRLQSRVGGSCVGPVRPGAALAPLARLAIDSGAAEGPSEGGPGGAGGAPGAPASLPPGLEQDRGASGRALAGAGLAGGDPRVRRERRFSLDLRGGSR